MKIRTDPHIKIHEPATPSRRKKNSKIESIY